MDEIFQEKATFNTLSAFLWKHLYVGHLVNNCWNKASKELYNQIVVIKTLRFIYLLFLPMNLNVLMPVIQLGNAFVTFFQQVAHSSNASAFLIPLSLQCMQKEGSWY